MSEAAAALPTWFYAGLGGVLLANMLEGWLEGAPNFFAAAETADEPEDLRTPPEQTRLHLFAPVDTGSSVPPSREHRAPVCPARVGSGTGLERSRDPHPRPGPGKDRDRDDQARRLQDLGGGCLDGPSGCCVCLGSLAAGALEPGLVSATGVVCAHSDAGHRRGWLLRSGGFQRRPLARLEGDHGPSRAPFFARAPPGR